MEVRLWIMEGKVVAAMSNGTVVLGSFVLYGHLVKAHTNLSFSPYSMSAAYIYIYIYIYLYIYIYIYI